MKGRNIFVFAVILLTTVIGVLLVKSRPVIGDEHSQTPSPPAWKAVPQDGIITASGRYYLEQDMQVDRSIGIEVNADDVTLDLRGHALRFTGLPRDGAYGIVANNRRDLTVTNGAIGGFWFNIHCTQNEGLRIRDVSFDDIPYLAVNVAQSKNVAISHNAFANFRYDLPKAKDSTYVIGINIGAEDVVISNNRFAAQPKNGAAGVDVETVFVLFSANVSKDCVVAHNDMAASEVLPRSYGVWVATDAQATIAHNHVRNMKYAVCLASDATAVVCFNRFVAETTPETAAPIETIGISAPAPKDIFDIKNAFEGVSIPSVTPSSSRPRRVSGG
ncbi:MAG: right-handed parallel beta-helix repeat-containing protein [Pirellulales bacterium]